MIALQRPYGRVLVANRGEIACRVMRTARLKGLETVAIYSDADCDSLHVRQADTHTAIGGALPRDSYLNVEAILAAVRRTGADAVHPGYGFLAENPDFAEAVIAAGVVWIGPSPHAIRAMGNKARFDQMSAFFGDAGSGARAGVWESAAGVPQDRPEFKAETRRLLEKQAKKRKAEAMV